MNRKEFYHRYQNFEKPASTFYHKYIPKKFGKLIAYPLYRLNFSPNQLSLLSFLLLIASISCLFLYEGIISHLLFFSISLLSYSLDCIDGVLARIMEKQTKFGAFLDLLLDRTGELILYIAIFIYAYQHLNFIEGILLTVSLSIKYIYGIGSLIRSAKVPELNNVMKNKEGGILKMVVKFFYEFMDTGTFYFFLTIFFIIDKYELIFLYGGLSFLLLLGMAYIVFRNEVRT